MRLKFVKQELDYSDTDGRRDSMITTLCERFKEVSLAMVMFRTSCLCQFVFRFCPRGRGGGPRKGKYPMKHLKSIEIQKRR